MAADAALQFDAITTELSGYTACLALLDSGQAFDAVCAASDLIAIGAMRALRERGLRVPQDVAVSGFDDIALAASVAPALSTVQQDTKQAGALLVESLVALIRGDAAQSRTIPVRLAVRESSTSSGLQPPLGWNPSTAAESSDGLRGKAASGNATR